MIDPFKIQEIAKHATPEELIKLQAMLKKVPLPLWSPLPGPQTEAYNCIADILYFGGSGGCAKTELLIGLSLTHHYRSMIFRKQATELPSIIDRFTEIIGSRDGFNGQNNIWRLPATIVSRHDCQVEFGSTPNPGDHEKYRGRPHDFIGFDEIPAFTEYEVRFLCGWLRTVKKNQRCRVVFAGNPPEDPSNLEKGGWLIKFFSPWLDPDHPNPAKSGELRYFVMMDGKEVERPHSKPFEWRDHILTPKSRTFIPGTVEDNPFLMATGYDQTLEALPEPLRSQMRYGNFSVGKNADPWQALPTEWVKAAQDRWKPEGKRGKMDSMGVDVSRGGKDRTCMTSRYSDWYSIPVTYPGSFVTDGNAAAGLVFLNLKDAAPVYIDIVNCGTSAYDHLKNNDIHVVGINGTATGNGTDRSGVLRFYNKRAEIYWKFREALDPAYGSEVALPPGNQIRAELCAAKWGLTARFDGKGIKIEDKSEIIKRIGVSPDEGESILYASVKTDKRRLSGPEDEIQRILRSRSGSGSNCA
jgi:hypothetical protein